MTVLQKQGGRYFQSSFCCRLWEKHCLHALGLSSSLCIRKRAGLSLSPTQPRPHYGLCTWGWEGCGRMGGMWEEEEGIGKDGALPFFCSTMKPCVKKSLSQTRWNMVEDTVSHASLGELWGLSLLNCPWSLQRTLGVLLPLHLAGL